MQGFIHPATEFSPAKPTRMGKSIIMPSPRFGIAALAIIMATVWSSLPAWASPPEPPAAAFQGGSYDGWDSDRMALSFSMGGPAVTLSSGSNHFFNVTLGDRQALGPLTVRESADADNRGIKSDATLTIGFQAALNLRWNIDNLVLSGDASGKVNPPVTLANDGHHLRIPILTDFDANDDLVLSGLAIEGFLSCAQTSANLLLDLSDNGLWDITDDYMLTVGMVWSGGSYDGWDRNMTTEPTALFRRGTMIRIR